MHRAIVRPEPRLATSRLLLRPIGEDDLDPLVAEVNDLAVARMLARVPHPYGRSDAEAFLASVERGEGSDFSLLITHDERIIGGIGLARMTADCEFGYWLGRAHWGKGFATEAGGAFLAYVFDAYRIARITSGAFVDNPASLRVQDKLGFVRLGRRFVKCLARGVAVDHIDTILTRARFEETRR